MSNRNQRPKAKNIAKDAVRDARKRSKPNRGAVRLSRPAPRQKDRGMDIGKFSRQLRAHQSKNMSAACRKACRDLITPADGRLSQAYVDSTHMADVEAVQIYRAVSRGSFAAQADGVAFAYFDARALASDATCGVTSLATGVETAMQRGQPCGVLAGAPQRYNDVPWTRADIQDHTGLPFVNYKMAYICGELRVWNTTNVLNANGINSTRSIPLEEFAENTIFVNQAQIPDAEIGSGLEACRIFHMAESVNDIAWENLVNLQSPNHMSAFTTTVPPVGNTPMAQTHLFLHVGAPTVPQTFYYELVSYFYLFGARVNATSPLIRVPNLWQCIRESFSDGIKRHTVYSENGELERNTQSYIDRAVKYAENFMAEKADEVLEMAISGLGKAAVAAIGL